MHCPFGVCLNKQEQDIKMFALSDATIAVIRQVLVKVHPNINGRYI